MNAFANFEVDSSEEEKEGVEVRCILPTLYLRKWHVTIITYITSFPTSFVMNRQGLGPQADIFCMA